MVDDEPSPPDELKGQVICLSVDEHESLVEYSAFSPRMSFAGCVFQMSDSRSVVTANRVQPFLDRDFPRRPVEARPSFFSRGPFLIFPSFEEDADRNGQHHDHAGDGNSGNGARGKRRSFGFRGG